MHPQRPWLPPTVRSSKLGANASHPFYSARATHSPKNFTWQRSRNPFSALISLPPFGWPLKCLISVSLVSTISMWWHLVLPAFPPSAVSMLPVFTLSTPLSTSFPSCSSPASSPRTPISTVWSTTSPLMVHLFTLVLVVSNRSSWRLPKLNLPRWKGWASSDVPTLPRHHHFTWFLNQVAAGDLAVTSGASTMPWWTIGTHCPTYKISMAVWRARRSFPRWT